MSEKLGICDIKQYEHSGPHYQIPEIDQRVLPFPCKNWKPVEAYPLSPEITSLKFGDVLDVSSGVAVKIESKDQDKDTAPWNRGETL